MKKLLACLLAVLMIAALCACGKTETPAKTDDTGDLQPAGTGEAAEVSEAADASGADTFVLTDDMKNADAAGSLNEEKYEKALACVGESVDVLYEAIGEPESEPHYASSCLEMGAQDGQLYYDADGFYVTTLKNDSGETVMGVVTYG